MHNRPQAIRCCNSNECASIVTSAGVLGPLDWVVAAGEHWHVAGPNGAGKSTLSGVAVRRSFTRGRRTPPAAWSPPGTPVAEWKDTVGLVSPELQSRMAALQCTAEEIVISGLHSSIGLDEPPTARERALARRWLDRVGIGGLGGRRPRELSYGQLRRVLFARALVRGRRLLLLDEHLDGLDAEVRTLVAKKIEAAVRAGTQVVLAHAHAEDVPAFVTRRLELGLPRRRRVTASGPAESPLEIAAVARRRRRSRHSPASRSRSRVRAIALRSRVPPAKRFNKLRRGIRSRRTERTQRADPCQTSVAPPTVPRSSATGRAG